MALITYKEWQLQVGASTPLSQNAPDYKIDIDNGRVVKIDDMGGAKRLATASGELETKADRLYGMEKPRNKFLRRKIHVQN